MAGVKSLLPRLLRLRDAPAYLGMDRNRFNAEVRPYVIEIPIGEQGIAFDRLELDAWVDHYK
jgi:predicted DNA-binding transcriptional regulator AlpA